jgi:hypothetical protein
MRLAPTVVPAALVLLALPVAARARSQSQSQDAQGEGGPGVDGEYVQLVVGQRARLCPGGNCRAPICDDPATAVISGDGSGVLEARAPGFTTCSVDYGLGQRRVLQVEVLPRPGTPPARPGVPSQPPAPAYPAPTYPVSPGTAPPPPPPIPAPRPSATTGASAVATPSADSGATAPVYRWTAPDGSVQFGYQQDIPPSQRDRATRVTAQISVVPAPQLPSVPPARAAAPPPVERPRPPAEPPAEIDLPPPADVAPPDTIEPGELQCWTAANGRMTCAPYGQRQPVRPRTGPPAPGSASSPSR